MSISDAIREAELKIEKYLASGFYGQTTEADRRAIAHLLAHMKAVRWLPGFDHIPDDELLRGRLAAIAKSFGTSCEVARQAYHPGALDVNPPAQGPQDCDCADADEVVWGDQD